MTPATTQLSDQRKYDVLVVGGGMIGLSIARELARSGHRVGVIDRRTTPHIASWAAGGLLPPPIARAAHDPLEQIRGLSHQLFPAWCAELEAATGVALELERCGGIYLGRMPGERMALHAAVDQWQADGVSIERWTAKQLAENEPALALQAETTEIYHLPDEIQVRTPRLLQALRSELDQLGVSITQVDDCSWELSAVGSPRLVTSSGTVAAHSYCLATGPWASQLLAPLGISLPIEPRRGQIALFKTAQRLLHRVINEGPRYLVSRADGHLLVGSTVEEVGFDGDTTPQAIAELVRFARSLVPALVDHQPIATWAGLRPWSPDGVPYLGVVPRYHQIWFAGAHFRSGVHLAPATARLMKQMMCGEVTQLEMSPFSLAR